MPVLGQGHWFKTELTSSLYSQGEGIRRKREQMCYQSWAGAIETDFIENQP